MNLNNRQQLLGILAIVAVALLAGDRLLIDPLTQLWKQRSAEIARLKQSVAQGTSLLDRESLIRERWQQMQTNTLATEDSEAENQVLRAFERWADDSRIAVNGIKPQWKRSDDFATFECRVDAAGSLSEITRFLYEIEKDPLGFKVDFAEITSRDDRGQQLVLGLQVSGLQLNLREP